MRIAVPKNAKQVPGTAALLVNSKNLALKQADLGLDLDKNTY
ncbi:hypothetical protein [Pedobacter borealis]|nr:hypothetical protein [Pedobacter borealis]